MESFNIKYREIRPYRGCHLAVIRCEDNASGVQYKHNAFGEGIHSGSISKDKDSEPEVQAIRFDANMFTVSEARAWLDDHNWKYLSLAPASSDKLFSDIINEQDN